MARLIDADALKKENERLMHCDFPYLSEITLEELIDEAPTIDAVQVIRCKDCRWFINKECAIYCLQSAFDEAYCYYAERRGEE